MSEVIIDIPATMEGYQTFIRAKRLPSYTVRGRQVITDDISYAGVFGGDIDAIDMDLNAPHLMPFQDHLTRLALKRRRAALWQDCGLGKTPQGLAWAHAVARHGKVLGLVPLAVYKQWRQECQRFHGHDLIDLRAGQAWTEGIAIANYESRRDIDMRGVQGVFLDESSILKNEQGETRDWLCDLVANVPYRLALSATPAPNDHAEYASHAVFLGYARTAKEFYSQYFRKDGTQWKLRGHAIDPFYRNLASWGSYIYSPKACGFEQTTEMGEEPEYIYQHVKTHDGYKATSGRMFGGADAAEDRSGVFGEIRSVPGPRLSLIESWAADKRCVIWASRNAEETAIRDVIGRQSCAVLNGQMPIEERIEYVEAYRTGQLKHIISKPRVLGFGVNLPECDHMIFSGFTFSYEQDYQAVRRAHRYGRKGRLQVLYPYTDPELPILQTLRQKRGRFLTDVMELQKRFWRSE